MPKQNQSWENKCALAWPVLTTMARERKTIFYKQLGEAVGIHHRSVRYVLDVIQRYCMEAGLPPLTAIVVSKSQRRPGSGFVAWDIDDLESGITLVYGEDWAAKANPFLGFGENETFETLARELINDPGASEAIYRRVKDRGIAQKIFREALIIAYDHQCAMCDLSFYDALEAAHIVPFWECSAEQKMDVCNGLLLCANHHRLFDTEWITVSADHVIQFSDPNMRDGPYSKSDIAASVGLHGTKVRCPADPKLRPKFPSRDTD